MVLERRLSRSERRRETTDARLDMKRKWHNVLGGVLSVPLRPPPPTYLQVPAPRSRSQPRPGRLLMMHPSNVAGMGVGPNTTRSPLLLLLGPIAGHSQFQILGLPPSRRRAGAAGQPERATEVGHS